VKLTSKILNWYKFNQRPLPWRESKNPYHIWISEIILQQTRVAQGTSYYLNFILRFSNVNELAQAQIDDVMQHWKGLGYYSRAINLHKAAEQIVHDFNGKFPTTSKELVKLSGIGPYTAAAIASICFGEEIAAIDGNYYRVFSRIFADDFDISSPKAYKYFKELTQDLVDENHPGDFNQAVMDLGATICTPKNPQCSICPIQAECLAFQTGKVNEFPVKIKRTKVLQFSLKYYLVKNGNQFLIRRRNKDSIWKMLYEFPTEIPLEWENETINHKKVSHKLTHRELKIDFYKVEIKDKNAFEEFARQKHFEIVDKKSSHKKSFPKPLEKIIDLWIEN